ncbi:hypothetical protein RDMS_07060 [Deinococcus sp. RL]|uniref:hypothetical protein n=1 Tax=Deinococcus sp. RL TaxID=1489678 RepID=UPI0004D5E4A5|nr:hypothetical protein [Deinococcus sp. RL]KEF34400.1 hypothetical protein RDMS_07060 [Deinococcus sp. RL]
MTGSKTGRRWSGETGRRVLALSALLGGAAGAAGLEFGVTAAVPSGLLPRVAVTDLEWGRLSFGAAASTRALEARVSGGLSLPPAGAVTLTGGAAVTGRGGVRLETRASGTLGPVALNVGVRAFTAPATDVDPLAAWSLAPIDERARGWGADLTARYRLSRTLVAVAGGEVGPQPQAFAGAEWRRELTRPLPPSEGEDPAADPLTERVGSLTLRLGARAGADVLGVTGGVTYAAETGPSASVDVLAGPGSWGAVGSVGLPGLLGEESAARLYVAYEPWRRAAALRAGAELERPLGPGTLLAEVRGGSGGFGVRGTYRFSLGGGEGPGE